MRTDTLYCRVDWDPVLEEPQESFNPRGFGQSGRVRGRGGGGPFQALLSTVWNTVSAHLLCHQCPYVDLGIDPPTLSI